MMQVQPLGSRETDSAFLLGRTISLCFALTSPQSIFFHLLLRLRTLSLSSPPIHNTQTHAHICFFTRSFYAQKHIFALSFNLCVCVCVCVFTFQLAMAMSKQKKLHVALYLVLGILALQVMCTKEEGVERQTVGAGTWCVAKSDASTTELQAALDWVCGQESGQGNVDCSPVSSGGVCDSPDTLVAHASYAFNVYFQNVNQAAGSCDFGGCAQTTNTDPSLGGCTYASSSISSGFLSTGNSSSLSPSNGGPINRLSLSTPLVSLNILMCLSVPLMFKL